MDSEVISNRFKNQIYLAAVCLVVNYLNSRVPFFFIRFEMGIMLSTRLERVKRLNEIMNFILIMASAW